MADLDFTLRRKNGAGYDVLLPTTTWTQVEGKPTTFTPTAHTHGQISNTGAITAAVVTPANTDTIVITDTSDSGILKRGITIGTGTTTFLRNDGTWATPADSTTLSGLGITATAAELNVLDGITATTAELNFTDGVTSNIQTQLNSRTRFYNDATLNTSTDTASFITELTNDYGCFQNNNVVLKLTWSYSGNSNLNTGHPTIGTIELAGCVIETWGGTYKHVRITRPNTGTGGQGVYEYNDQGVDYSPGWREIWTSESDGAGSGLDADLLDGNHASAFYLATNPSGYQTAAQVSATVSALVDSAPGTLDTLNELAAALGDDPNFATTVSTSIGAKVSKSGDTMTGTLVVGQIDAGNPSASTDNIRVSGYGILGNRGSFYMTNANPSGDIQFGIGGVHAAATKMKISSNGVVDIGGNTVFHDGYHPNADVLTTARNINGVSFNGSADITITAAPTAHTHAISDVTGLQTALDAKQNSATALTTSTTFGGDVSGTYNAIVVADDSHNHIISNVDGLQSALDGKQSLITGAATTITGSNLTASRALTSSSTGKVAVSATTSTELGYVSGVTSSIQTQLDNKAATSHTHTIANVTGLQTSLDAKANTADVVTLAGAQTITGGKTFGAAVDVSRNSTNTYSFDLRFGTNATYFGPAIRGNGTNLERTYYTTTGTIWDSANDGSGSGLDADLLDGQHASAFAAASHTHPGNWVLVGGSATTATTMAHTTASSVPSMTLSPGGIGSGDLLAIEVSSNSSTLTSAQRNIVFVRLGTNQTTLGMSMMSFGSLNSTTTGNQNVWSGLVRYLSSTSIGTRYGGFENLSATGNKTFGTFYIFRVWKVIE